MMNHYYDAKVENLVKVAATKDASGRVWLPKRMQGGYFRALVKAGWVKRDETPLGAPSYTITPEGQARLDAYKPVDVFAGPHGQKALKTFTDMGTVAADWFHPAINWVREMRWVTVEAWCPDCDGDRYVRYDAEKKLIPAPAKIPSGQVGHYTAAAERREHFALARKEAGIHSRDGNCRKCQNRRGESTGKVMECVERLVMVGHIIWAANTKFISRFGNGGTCAAQCALCGKGIPSGELVPMAHDKDGKHLGMWVGVDCGRKFAKIAQMKPDQDKNAAQLQYFLDDNYVKGRT